jgi:DNA-directed RNA polymerase specialized sigma24 family protein
MDRVSYIINASGQLRRKIWASLPFSLRLADFFTRLAVSFSEAFGKTIYAEFLIQGVTEMPDIKGQPASEFDLSHKPVADHLPSGYGKEFGQQAYRVLMRKVNRPEVVENIMGDFLVNFLEKGSKHIQPGTSLRVAEGYVITSLLNEWKNVLRTKSRRIKERSDIYYSPEGREERIEQPVYDEDDLERQVKRMLPRMQSHLKAIHPDAPLYVKLSLIDGYSDREIVGDIEHGIPSMLTQPYGKRGNPLDEKDWGMVYKPKIFELLKKNFSELQSIAV